MTKKASGTFIVFEGIDGCGKTTQALDLKETLINRGFDAVFVREPTSGKWGMKIREIAARGREHITPEDELNYFVWDRAEDVELNIGPVLERGGVVIADRYFYSNIAYQAALGLDEKLIRKKNAEFPVPDMVVMLEISPKLSGMRIVDGRKDQANKGYEQYGFLKKVKKIYDRLDDDNIVRLDGSLGRDQVKELIFSFVAPLLGITV